MDDATSPPPPFPLLPFFLTGEQGSRLPCQWDHHGRIGLDF